VFAFKRYSMNTTKERNLEDEEKKKKKRKKIDMWHHSYNASARVAA